jgi:uncharacterized membrane protein YtjA (UPF0391 family)
MQTNQVPARRRNPALQQGILFGVIFGIIILINDLLGDFSGLGATAGIISILLFLVELFLYAAAGFRASAQTGRVGTGTLAGIFSSGVSLDSLPPSSSPSLPRISYYNALKLLLMPFTFTSYILVR